MTSIVIGGSFGSGVASTLITSASKTDFDLARREAAREKMQTAQTFQLTNQMLFPRQATQQWIDEIEQRIVERQVQATNAIADALKAKRSKTENYRQAYGGRRAEWSTTNVPKTWDTNEMSTMLLRGHEVPASMYGYLAHENNTCLPENGTADEIKDGILAVLEESAASVSRRVTHCLGMYDINVLTFEVDLLDQRMTIHCLTAKPVMQVNTIMGNHKVRTSMPPRARVCVTTFVEENRRTDGHLKADKPAKQEVVRDFFYEDGTIVRDEPQHWSAGMKHEPGDIIRIGTIAHRVEDTKRAINWEGIAFDGDPIAGRDDFGRIQNGTPFQPGERASWHSARNR